MDVYFVLPALFGMFSLVCGAGLAPPSADPPSASEPHSDAHLRTKRCSCASFLDKECVYFCHLDIIWVNTPERVVSYGLGNAPRARRSLPQRTRPQRTRPRCRCLRGDDHKCSSFCRREQRDGRPDPASSPEPRGRWILEKRRLRRRWDAQSSAS